MTHDDVAVDFQAQAEDILVPPLLRPTKLFDFSNISSPSHYLPPEQLSFR